MQEFVQQHVGDVIGCLRGWDRMRLRGTIRCVAHGKGLAAFLLRSGRQLSDFGSFAAWASGRLRQSIEGVTAAAGRPSQYLPNPRVSKEEVAKAIALRDKVEQGLICTLSAVEPCWSFRLVQKKDGEGIAMTRAYRKCLHLYQYYIHPIFGFMHLRLQTWMPFNLHLCLNGREWLSRQMDAAGIKYARRENCFVWISDAAAAQGLLQQQVEFQWEPVLRQIVQQTNPAIGEIMHPYDVNYYWSIDESEWATDVMFRSEPVLSRLYPSLIRHGMESFGSRDVMRFLGHRVPLQGVHGNVKLEVVSDIKQRPEGIRIKHRLGENSVKMYNKQGSVLRVETTLNNVLQLKTPRRENNKVVWREMRKGVADVRRRAEVSDQANDRYLEALAAVGTPRPLKELTAGVARRVMWNGQPVRGLNLFAEDDVRLLEIVGGGEFLLNGFRNRNVQQALFGSPAADEKESRRRSGQVSRKLRMLRAHGLIQKLPHTHRYVVSEKGRQLIAALTAARNADIAKLAKAA